MTKGMLLGEAKKVTDNTSVPRASLPEVIWWLMVTTIAGMGGSSVPPID